jgi:RimJ/RimL family protein N-acetyltransferase
VRDLSEIELPTLSDGRLVVRPYRPDDAPANVALCDDPTIARGETLPSPYAPADAEAWLGDARRTGVASGGVRLLLGWCFDELGLGRLQMRADARNEASRRMIEHCGFKYEGLLRSYAVVNGVQTDDVIYSLLPEDVA